ncbi:MAG: ATP-binding protein [Acidobacteriota bacterium]|nr:ATP-binding protein [Acidobacteriota bacterium]MDH3528591.1 ATP-binding protein [Acidobacteriota bacterium]
MAESGNKDIGKQKRKPPWILGAIVVGLLLFLFLLQSSNVWKSITVSSSGETLMLYALSSLNFIAFVVFALILARSLLKLRQERRALQLGSKLKTRLLIYFAGISLLPLIAMAVFSYLYVNRAIERWFTQMPENVVRQAGQLQSDAARDQQGKVKATARMVALLLKDREPDEESLETIRKAGNLSVIEVLGDNNRPLYSSRGDIASERATELSEVESLIRMGDLDNPVLSDGTGFDAAVADLSGGKTLLIVPAPGPKGDVGELVNSTLQEFDLLKANQVFVRQLGLTTLGLLTFLLIFASSWAAFYVAKGLTRPIRALAEGADEIARGNFSHRVDVFAEDELELLVRAFNTMTGKLEEKSNELEERRRYTETILQSLSTGVISFDSENRVTTINKAAIEMLRLDHGDFVGFKLPELVRTENSVVFEKLIARAARVGYANEQNVLFRKNTDGSSGATDEVIVALAATELPDDSGAVVVIEDLSELISAQRAAAWQEVARRMAHEIKNPLTPIQLSAERIAKRFASGSNGRSESASVDGQTEDVVNEGTDTILREVASLKSMVDEFSKFARLPDADKKETDIAKVIEQTAALYKGRTGSVEILLNLEKDLPMVNADSEQLKRVFVNLIDNAIESFPDSGINDSVSINAVFEKQRELIRVEVVDNGAGINPADINRLFQPYFSTKGRGTGLGLAIVHRIVREHQGKITAAQNQPRGSKFSMELPVQVT